MPQIFHPATNTLARISVLGGAGILALTGWLLLAVGRSDYATEVNVVRSQPVEFSHEHHVGGLGIDCRFCHTSAEDSNMAGIPPTETCMECHRHIWRDSPRLAVVRESFRSGRPIRWTRVHDLPDFVYFNHSIHVNKGVGCTTCHGQVDRMPLMWQEKSLQMEWCIDCHRSPELYVRPRDAVFSVDYTPPGDQLEFGRRLVAEYQIQKLTSCSTCHR